MALPPQPYPLPSRLHCHDGAMRRVGVELEFAGLRPEQILTAVVAALGGRAERLTQVQYLIQDTRVGPIELELDFRWMQKAASESEQLDDLPTWVLEVSQWTTGLLERIASQVVPWEIVTGPVPMAQLHHLDAMVDALRSAGALGTRHAPHFAFGVHLNPELPAMDAVTLRRYLKAFLCLKDWLRAQSALDLSRRLTPYITDFDDDYVRLVVDPAYQPTLEQLIDDYLRFNPTRNRSLDMLPAFAEIDETRVRATVNDPLIKARPALHYRLPNCEIDDPGWNLRALWEDWLQVEELAQDAARLDAMGVAYCDWLDRFHVPFDDGWIRETRAWLN